MLGNKYMYSPPIRLQLEENLFTHYLTKTAHYVQNVHGCPGVTGGLSPLCASPETDKRLI